ncbi:hypothetical protein QYE76_047114 [Lolium multiflorum]|uniref:Uncharacterized protein n=2 Tax=Lolium TaxID=4520 RepID=A0AAD8X1B1_LOLMU|nr:hypothetical protein QYE76_047114 [Lolium multiflorum]
MKEITGIVGSQEDLEVVFNVLSLEGAENVEPSQLLDPNRLCGESDALVRFSAGPFGLLVMASVDLEEHMTIFFRVFRHLDM